MTHEEAWARLTPREREVVRALVDRGGSTKEAAHELGLARHTVRNFRRDINERLGTSGLIEALTVLGLVRRPPVR